MPNSPAIPLPGRSGSGRQAIDFGQFSIMTAVYFGSESDVFFTFSLRAGRFAGLRPRPPWPPGRWFGRAGAYIIAGLLLGLTIRDVVLIDRLSLAFRPGLCVLTGETGAGKSILLDALGLALGRRAEAGLVRAGAKEAAVAAEFAVGRNHPAHAILRAAGREDAGETIVLRRLLATDGRSRAFVNDEPSSVGLLRELGDSLVEIQGQFEQCRLLEPANHRMILDAFARD